MGATTKFSTYENNTYDLIPKIAPKPQGTHKEPNPMYLKSVSFEHTKNLEVDQLQVKLQSQKCKEEGAIMLSLSPVVLDTKNRPENFKVCR
jgi:hypothetical protein